MNVFLRVCPFLIALVCLCVFVCLCVCSMCFDVFQCVSRCFNVFRCLFDVVQWCFDVVSVFFQGFSMCFDCVSMFFNGLFDVFRCFGYLIGHGKGVKMTRPIISIICFNMACTTFKTGRRGPKSLWGKKQFCYPPVGCSPLYVSLTN